MRIDSSPATHTHTPPVRRARTEQTEPTAAPAPAASPKPGRGAEHRSDVATLRQWVNHPERRDAIALPDLEATGGSKGFANALAAYRSVLAELAPPPAPPAPVVDPVVDPTVDPVVNPVVDPTVDPVVDAVVDPAPPVTTDETTDAPVAG